jgi:hypothetical protein
MEVYIGDSLLNMEFNGQEEHIFGFYIHLAEQYALLKDQYAPKRVNVL